MRGLSPPPLFKVEGLEPPCPPPPISLPMCVVYNILPNYYSKKKKISFVPTFYIEFSTEYV